MVIGYIERENYVQTNSTLSNINVTYEIVDNGRLETIYNK